MDASAMPQSHISTLQEIRTRLRCMITTTEALRAKLTGPRPETPSPENKTSQESIQVLMLDIDRFSLRLEKMLNEQHEIVGDFGESQSGKAYA